MQETPTSQQPPQHTLYPPQPPMYPPPTYQPPQKPPHSNKQLWLIIGIVVAGLIAGGIFGSIAAVQMPKASISPTPEPTQPITAQPTWVGTQIFDTPAETSQPTPTPQPTQSSAQIEKAYKNSSYDTTVATVDKQGNTWKGKDVHFACTIYNFVKDENGNTAYSNVHDPNTSGVILIVYPKGTDFEKLNEGDTLEVWGFDSGTISGTNAFGADIQIVEVVAVYMTDQTTGYATH